MAAPVTAETILAELRRLWASLAGAHAQGQSEGVLRACAMTLIVLSDESDSTQAVSETLAQVMRDHPHRAILVQVRPGAPLEYNVTAQCWLPSGRQQQICCEQIEIAGSEESLGDIAPVLAALAAPDLPVVGWCRSVRLAPSDAARQIFGAANRILVDTTHFGDAAGGLTFVAGARRFADLAWTRVTRWREIVAQLFSDPSLTATIPAISEIAVLYADEKPPATAAYLGAWVVSSLGHSTAVRFERVPFLGGGIEGLVLSGAERRISIRRVEGTAVLIEFDGRKACTSAPHLSDAELLRDELSMSGRDAAFERALPEAVRMVGGASR